MLDVNQLLAQFDSRIENVTDEILDFWTNLLNVRETRQLFQKGIKVSQKIVDLQKLLQEIELKQSKKESKIYIQMAGFYKMVLFKTNEYLLMMEKATQALHMKKLSIENRDKE